MIKTKAKGSRRERQVKKMLEAQGYLCSKSGSSLGLFDIIAISENEVRLIQVKSSYCSPAERERIRLFKCPSEVVKEIWVFKKGKEIKQIIY